MQVKGETMDDLKFSRLMVELAEKRAELRDLEVQVEAEVLARKQTVDMPGVKAQYRRPSKKYDYKAAVTQHKTGDMLSSIVDKVIERHTKTREYTSWKSVCFDLEIPEERIPFEENEAQVRFVYKGSEE